MPLISSLGTMNAVGFGFSAGAKFVPFVFTGNATLNPAIKVYNWTTNGFGTAYSSVPGDKVYDILFTSTNDTIIYCTESTGGNQVKFAPWVNGVGSGSTNASIVAAPGQLQYAKLNPSENTIAIGHNTTPWISVYPWGKSSGFGTKYANPSTMLTGNNGKPAFNKAGNLLAVGQTDTPFINVYNWSSGFGTKYANPATLPTSGSTTYVTFNSTGTVLALSGDTSPYVAAYLWSSGFGTKYANPATAVSGYATSVQFNNIGSEIIIGADGAIGGNVYAWSNGFSTKRAAAVGGSAISKAFFNSTSTNVVCSTVSSPFINVFPWQVGTGYGVKYANPSSLPANYLSTVGFSN